MFENPRRGRQASNFTRNVPKILDLKSSSEQIFSENCRWVPLKSGNSITMKELIDLYPFCSSEQAWRNEVEAWVNNSLYFVFPSLDLMPFFGGMLERSIINNIHFFLNAGLSIGHKPSSPPCLSRSTFWKLKVLLLVLYYGMAWGLHISPL